MASSFNNTGSNAGNPQGGFLSTVWNKGVKPLFQSPQKDFTGNFGTNQNYAGTGGANYAAPQKGLLDTHTPSTPVKSITQGDTKVDFHPPTDTGKTQSGLITPASAAQTVYDQSQLNNNPEYQQLSQQQNKLVQAQQGATLAPYAGQNQSLGQSYANLGRPQSTGNLAGELGNFNAQEGIALSGNAAERQALLSGAQLGTQGATSVLNASLPQQVSPTNVPFNPLSGTYGNPAASAYGANGLAGVGGLLQQQQQGADTQNMIGAYNQAKPLIESAKQQIAKVGFNGSPFALGNALQNWVNKDVVPSGDYANIFNTISEIATTISPVLGAQGNQTNLKTMIAQEFIPLLMQGKDLSTVFDTIENNALAKIQANKNTATGQSLNVPGNSGSTGGGVWDF